jgi:hypothetical protein
MEKFVRWGSPKGISCYGYHKEKMPKLITSVVSMSTDKRKLSALVLAMLLAGTCASILTFWTTAYAPGVTPDSAVYIETARNLFSKNSFFAYGEPFTHYPPTYPLLLALGGVLESGHVLQASRWLGAFFFAANIVLLGNCGSGVHRA